MVNKQRSDPKTHYCGLLGVWGPEYFFKLCLNSTWVKIPSSAWELNFPKHKEATCNKISSDWQMSLTNVSYPDLDSASLARKILKILCLVCPLFGQAARYTPPTIVPDLHTAGFWEKKWDSYSFLHAGPAPKPAFTLEPAETFLSSTRFSLLFESTWSSTAHVASCLLICTSCSMAWIVSIFWLRTMSYPFYFNLSYTTS